MRKISFLFMIYDSIHLEELWNIFFLNIDPSLYSIYIHYKYDKPLRYFEKFKLKNCIETLYAHVSQISCINLLLREALMDKENEHFIFVSQSCIPMKSFHVIYQLLDPSKSYFNVMPQTQCFPRCDSLLSHIPREHIQKSYTWNIYNRKHANVMLEEENTIDLYRSVYGPDEIYFITSMYRRGLENEIITTPNSAQDATTFTNWDDMNYRYVSTYSLKNYDEISKEELMYLLQSKCLFGRKFNVACSDSLSIKEYIDTIHL